MKKRYRIKNGLKIVIVILIAFAIIGTLKKRREPEQHKVVQTYIENEKTVREEINSELYDGIENTEQDAEIEENKSYEEITSIDASYSARMTSYYPEEGETTTASGFGIYDFGVNENGWFTYNDKLVIATASERLGETDMATYNLYDELILNIDGIDYNAIVLDVCGACMWDNRIDLFVSSYVYAKDVNIVVRR